MKKHVKDMANKLSDASKKGYDHLKSSYEKSEFKEGVSQASGVANDLLESSGIPKRLSQANQAIDEELNAISGKKVMDKLAAHIALQEQYNDVLAGKLEEALKRIEKLERKIGE